MESQVVMRWQVVNAGISGGAGGVVVGCEDQRSRAQTAGGANSREASRGATTGRVRDWVRRFAEFVVEL